jgi:hypothetical protein
LFATAIGEAVRGHRHTKRPSYQSPTHSSAANEEVGWRSDVVGICPNDRATTRFICTLLIEQNGGRIVARHTCQSNR